MPFEPIEFSPEFLTKFDLPEQIDQYHRYHYSSVFMHDRLHAALFKRTHYHRGESFDEHAFISNKNFLRVRLREAHQKNKAQSLKFEMEMISYVTLSKYTRSKISRLAKEITLAHLGIQIGEIQSTIITDETKPQKQRSVTALCKMLNKLASKTDKSIYINSMEVFIPFVLTPKEAKLIHVNIRENNGKGLSEKALLIFELGFEKCKEKIFSSE